MINKVTHPIKSQEERTKRHRLVLFLCYMMVFFRTVEGMKDKLEIELEVGKGTNVKFFLLEVTQSCLDSIINP